jgi:hypothetical protein
MRLVTTLSLLLLACPAGAVEPIKVAVMDLKTSEGIPREFRDSLLAVIPQTLDELGPFKAITRQDIEQMLALEKQKDALGCSDMTCIAEIGGALGADFLVTGSVLFVIDTYLVQLQLANVRQARVDARVSRSYKGGPQGLFDEMAVASKLLVRDVLAQRSGQVEVRMREEGATIKVDGKIVAVSPSPALTVPGGMHTLSVEKEGFVVFTRDVQVTEKQVTSLDVVLQPSEEFKSAYLRRARLVRGLGWGGVGLGVAGLAGAAVSFAVAHNRGTGLSTDINAYNAQAVRTQDQAQALANRKSSLGTLDSITATLGIVGLAGAATGASLLLLGSDPGRFEARLEVGGVAWRWSPLAATFVIADL